MSFNLDGLPPSEGLPRKAAKGPRKVKVLPAVEPPFVKADGTLELFQVSAAVKSGDEKIDEACPIMASWKVCQYLTEANATLDEGERILGLMELAERLSSVFARPPNTELGEATDVVRSISISLEPFRDEAELKARMYEAAKRGLKGEDAFAFLRIRPILAVRGSGFELALPHDYGWSVKGKFQRIALLMPGEAALIAGHAKRTN